MPVTQFEDPEYLEAVYATLFSLLKSAVLPDSLVFNLSARLAEPPDSIAAANQPALILFQGPMHAEQKGIFGPTKWIFTAVAAVYIRADTETMNPVGTSTPIPATTANRIVWALAQAMGNSTTPGGTPMIYQRQELGGLVYHAWIEGEVITSVVDQQMIVTVPINILAGPSD